MFITGGRKVVKNVGEFQRTVTDANGGRDVAVVVVRDPGGFRSGRVSSHHLRPRLSRQRRQGGTAQCSSDRICLFFSKLTPHVFPQTIYNTSFYPRLI